MKQVVITFKDCNPSPFEGGGHCKVAVDPAEETPVFIIDQVFYVKGADKKTYYFPLCNVLSVVVG